MARLPTKTICCLTLLAVAGCGDERSSESSSLKFVSTPADVVFINVNGKPLTFGMMQEQLKFEEAGKRFTENKSGED